MEQFRKVNYTKDWITVIYNYLDNNLKNILKKFNLDNFKIIKIYKNLSFVSLEDINIGLKVFFSWHDYFWPFNITFPYYYNQDILDRQYSKDTGLPYNLMWAQQYAALDEELGLKWKEYYIDNIYQINKVKFNFPDIDAFENTAILRAVYILIKGLTKINKIIKSPTALTITLTPDFSAKTKPEKINSLINTIQTPSIWHSGDLEKLFIDPGENLRNPKITID